MTKFGIGQAITRREDQRLLTGQGKYIDDMSLPNEAHLVFVRSPHARARIVSIDTSAAALGARRDRRDHRQGPGRRRRRRLPAHARA